MKYKCADNEEAAEALEKEKTAEEEVDEDEEGVEADTPGAMFYLEMKRRGLADDGEWSDLGLDLKEKWENAAADLEPSIT